MLNASKTYRGFLPTYYCCFKFFTPRHHCESVTPDLTAPKRVERYLFINYPQGSIRGNSLTGFWLEEEGSISFHFLKTILFRPSYYLLSIIWVQKVSLWWEWPDMVGQSSNYSSFTAPNLNKKRNSRFKMNDSYSKFFEL